MSEYTKIDQSYFVKDKLKYPGLAVVECYCENIASLKIMEAVIVKVKNEFRKEFKHLRLDMIHNAFVTKEFKALSIPTYLIFNKGNLVDKIDGMLPSKEFIGILNKHTKTTQIGINN